jgi:dihydroneopterin aldolase
MTDKVFINGLRAETVIGVYDWERNIRQPLIFDLEMATDNRAAAKDDDLTKAIDYAAISQRVIAEVEASSFQLIETLAEHLAALILEEFGVQWLQLRVLKPTAVAEADAVGVQIQRGDASFS